MLKPYTIRGPTTESPIVDMVRDSGQRVGAGLGLIPCMSDDVTLYRNALCACGVCIWCMSGTSDFEEEAISLFEEEAGER